MKNRSPRLSRPRGSPDKRARQRNIHKTQSNHILSIQQSTTYTYSKRSITTSPRSIHIQPTNDTVVNSVSESTNFPTQRRRIPVLPSTSSPIPTVVSHPSHSSSQSHVHTIPQRQFFKKIFNKGSGSSSQSTQRVYTEEEIEKFRKRAMEIRELEYKTEVMRKRAENDLRDLVDRTFGWMFHPTHDPRGLNDGQAGFRRDYSDLKPMLFSSHESPSVARDCTETILLRTGLNRYRDMVVEAYDDVVNHLNTKEPWGQRKKDRKYRLLNKLNKPYARYSPGDYRKRLQDHIDAKERKIREAEEEVEKRKKVVAMKRKAREAMGLEPDMDLEAEYKKLFEVDEEPEQREISEFEKFREAFKAQSDVYADEAGEEGGEKKEGEEEDEEAEILGYDEQGKPIKRKKLKPENFEQLKERMLAPHFRVDKFQGQGPLFDTEGNIIKYGFMGKGLNDEDIYEYIWGRRIPDHDVGTVSFFEEFPEYLRRPAEVYDEYNPAPVWEGTKELTYNPEDNGISKYALRRAHLRHRLYVSPLGDLVRGLWKLYNIDVFPFTHFRVPIAWFGARLRRVRGLPRALGRWVKTATHPFIDERFAYQANRYGEFRDRDVFHFVNEYDYLKEYMLPIVVGAIRERDFGILRSACSKQSLFSVVKWLKIQHTYGVFFESRRHYNIESLDIREVRKDENGYIVLDVECVLVEPPYYFNRMGGAIFNDRVQYKGLYKPAPLVMHFMLLRDYVHPDFDYKVIKFQADARRIRRVFNNIERIYHHAQRSRTQYFRTPKFYAVPRTTVDRTLYTRRTRIPAAYQANLEASTFAEKEMDFTHDMEARNSEMIKFRHAGLLTKYLAAVELEPIMDYVLAKQREHPAFQLHPIEKDSVRYWESRKEFDIIKFRQREARRVRAKQNTLHRYYHKLRAVAYLKHTFDHGGNLHEYRRLHIDKLALDANADDWVQQWIVDPERKGRPRFRNANRFKAKQLRNLLRLRRRFFRKGKGTRPNRRLLRYRKRERRWRTHRHRTVIKRRRRQARKKRKRRGHGKKRRYFKKRRRFAPFMERVYWKLPRGAFNEGLDFQNDRQSRINKIQGLTSLFGNKFKGPGYSRYDTSFYEKFHVWDGGYYNPSDNAYTKADEFNPANQPFDPRKLFFRSQLEDSTHVFQYYPNRDWNIPLRVTPPTEMEHARRRGDPARWMPKRFPHHTYRTLPHESVRFQDIPNAENLNENDDEQFAELDDLRKWKKPASFRF